MIYNTRVMVIPTVVILLSMLACNQQVTTPIPKTPSAALQQPQEPTTTVTTTPEWTAEVSQVKVNIRSEPDGDVVGYLQSGDRVTLLKCVDNWCQIREPAGWIWRGCLSDNPLKSKCEAKP